MRLTRGGSTLATLIWISAISWAGPGVGAANSNLEQNQLATGSVGSLAQVFIASIDGTDGSHFVQGRTPSMINSGYIVPTSTYWAQMSAEGEGEHAELPRIRLQSIDMPTSQSASAIPEPITIAIIVAGLFGLMTRRHRRSRMI